MCHSKTCNNKISKLHQGALRFVHDDKQATFEELPNIDKSVSIHHWNLQGFDTELYKVHRELTAELMNDIFLKKRCVVQL